MEYSGEKLIIELGDSTQSAGTQVAQEARFQVFGLKEPAGEW
jgi:hypothetical protein